jgi:unsaturated rhamnogalacturonyl hydrolase
MNYDTDALRGKLLQVARRTMSMPLPSWNWGEGVALLGLYRAWESLGDAEMLSFILGWAGGMAPGDEAVIKVNSTIPAYAAALAAAAARGPDYAAAGPLSGEDYVLYTRRIAEFLCGSHAKLGNGALMHTSQERSQLWVDTLFMAAVFLSYAGCRDKTAGYSGEAVRQFSSHLELLQTESGLCYHGYDDMSKRLIGTQWARGNAWIMAGFPDLAQWLGGSMTEELEQIRARVTRLADGLMKVQDVSGSWHTVLDQPSTYLETSSAAGIAYGLLKSFRLGLLDPSRYGQMAEKALLWLLCQIGEDGTVQRVSAGTPVLINYIVYNEISETRIQLWGQGLAMMALSEWLLALEGSEG